MDSHREIDRRSLELHRLVARKIEREPALLQQARDNLQRWRGLVAPASLPYLDQWEALLRRGPAACLAMATEDSERGAALRQNSPFAGVLSDRERFAFLRRWKETREAGDAARTA